MMNFLDFEKFQMPCIVKDTWKKDCLEKINIWWSVPILYNDKPVWRCNIQFKNGDTSSEQRFTHEDPETMMKEIRAFIESLK